MNAGRRRYFFFLLLLGLGAVSFAAADLASFARRQTVLAPTLFEVQPGSSLSTISKQLEQQKIITSATRFTLIVRIRRLANRLQAGEYEFQPGDTPQAIIDQLVSGRIKQYQLTIPEGLTIREISRLMPSRLCQNGEFEQLADDPALLKQWNIPAAYGEGYLFPSTYPYSKATTCRQLVSQMLKTFTEQFQLASTTATTEASLPLSRHELVTLASIIQKETGRLEEMPLIAAVLINRLRKGMRLECDPTVIYGLGDGFDGNLRKKDLLDASSPYNTYQHRGLPPGPICNPGIMALKAAHAPAPVDYLYFVSRNDGSHQFSATYQDHHKAVQRYQQRR